MRFAIEQRYTSATPAEVVAAYTDPALYATFHGLTKVAPPEVVDRVVDGRTVTMTLRMRFVAELNAAARAVVDPSKLSWLQDERYDLDTLTAEVVFRPENYGDRFSCKGGYTFTSDASTPTATVRATKGDLKVRMMLVGGQVENAVVSGLREHFAQEAPLVLGWVPARPS
jgi:hypothetical protein